MARDGLDGCTNSLGINGEERLTDLLTRNGCLMENT
jgi:hypothetical protein